MNKIKQIIFYLTLLFILSCTKTVDKRIINRPNEAYKSFIPNLNEQFQKVRITDIDPPYKKLHLQAISLLDEDSAYFHLIPYL